MPQWVTVLTTVLSVIGILGTAAFYLLYVGTKANREGKDETIETLEKSRNAYRDRNEELEKETAGLKAENKALREIATQTPEILNLTKVVTDSVAISNKVANNVAQLTGQVGKLIQQQGKKEINKS